MAKKSICLYFEVHQPLRLRTYKFFDIGKDSHYFDDFACRTLVKKAAQECYLPMNALLLDIIKRNKKFKVSFSIAGELLEQFDRYAPEVIDGFKALSATGNVEFVGCTYYHSLASLVSPSEFEHQVRKQEAALESYFGATPKVFCNTEMIYSDAIGKAIYALGYKTVLTEGARHIMGWRHPDFIYNNDIQPRQKLILRNWRLSDDVALRFNQREWDQWPLTADKYINWIKESEGEVVTLGMGYRTFGLTHPVSSGILDFFRAFVDMASKDADLEFVTPSEAAKKYKSVGGLDVAEPISWSDEERDTTAWLGNELQQEAFNKLYAQAEKLGLCGDPTLWIDFGRLQECDNFYYMSTKYFSEGPAKIHNPYPSPYEAFINYMNAVSDFIIRVDDMVSSKE